jgi:hypothetical protein
LSRAANVATFTARDIPGLRKGKVAGQEFELAEVVRTEVEGFRVGGAFDRFEDVSGRKI